MPKQDSSTPAPRADAQAGRTRPKRARRQISRLEKELDRLSGQVARRARRLSRARDRAEALERRLQALRAGDPSTHHDYCLHDKRTVSVLDPEPVVLGNGRSAVSGRCDVCGGRVVTMVAGRAAS